MQPPAPLLPESHARQRWLERQCRLASACVRPTTRLWPSALAGVRPSRHSRLKLDGCCLLLAPACLHMSALSCHDWPGPGYCLMLGAPAVRSVSANLQELPMWLQHMCLHPLSSLVLSPLACPGRLRFFAPGFVQDPDSLLLPERSTHRCILARHGGFLQMCGWRCRHPGAA